MIHKYQLNGYNICLDVHSGAVHVLDDIAYDVLDYCDENMQQTVPEKMLDELSAKYDRDELAETYEALYELYQAGKLKDSDIRKALFPIANQTGGVKTPEENREG